MAVFNQLKEGEKMRKVIIGLSIMFLSLLISSCCGTRICEKPIPIRSDNKNGFEFSKIVLKTHMGKPLTKAMAIPVLKSGSKPLNILILSGGGQNGAFGAGFLNGLADREDNQNLNFDIVTGISTGAMQATFAFLGPEYYQKLKTAYLNVSDKDIFYDRIFLSLLWSDSILNATPLRLLLEEMITLDVLEEVARIHRAGHRLFIGTLDLDMGDLVIWDMGAIAQDANEKSLKKYHDILMAATAIPVLFSPIKIEYLKSSGKYYEGLHVDGGTREILFFRQFMLNIRDTVKMQIQRYKKQIARLDRAQLTVVVNGQIGVSNKCVNDHWIPIGARTLSTLMDESKVNGVFRAYAISCAEGIAFRMIRIPDEVNKDLERDIFNPDTMEMLYKKGYQMARSDPIQWETKPPTAEDIELMCK
jgi:hypothetical protein